MQDSIKLQMLESSNLIKETIEISSDIKKASMIISKAFKKGNKILIAGNGGSAADAQHMSSELVGRFKLERQGLPCIALTTDTSIITSWANDYGFESIFERQVESLGKEGDVFIGISTSGKSLNILNATKKAKELGLKTVGILGNDGGAVKNFMDINLIVKSNVTARIQEVHGVIIHIICDSIDKKLN